MLSDAEATATGGIVSGKEGAFKIRSYDVPGLHMGLSVFSCYGIVELQSSQASASHGEESDILYVIYVFRVRDLPRPMSALYGCAQKTILEFTHIEDFKNVGVADDWRSGGINVRARTDRGC
jgi:hypothetical protein